MELLVVGHSLVIDANRKFWSVLGRGPGVRLELACPENWSSNLSKDVPFSPNPVTDAGIARIHPIPVRGAGNGSFFSFHWSNLWRLLQSRRYDVIYLNQETWALATLQLLSLKWVSRNRRTPVVLCVAQNLKKRKLRFLHPYERLIARGISDFFYCAREVREVLEWKGITGPSFYFPLPYDDEAYRPKPRDLQKPFKLGYLGRLSEDKGLRILLAALDELTAEGQDLKLVVGGAGPLAEELKRRREVEFLGLVPHREAHTFYDRIDCFILPSLTTPHWKEQFGRVIVESFGAGRPVIGSESGAIPEVLGKLEWNWTYPEASVSALKERILELRTHLTTDEGKSALQRSTRLNTELFSHSAVAAATLARFKTLAQRSAETHRR